MNETFILTDAEMVQLIKDLKEDEHKHTDTCLVCSGELIVLDIDDKE